MKTQTTVTCLLLSVAAFSSAALADGDFPFSIRPATPVDPAATAVELSASSDRELSLFAYRTTAGGLFVSKADGRGLGDPSLGGFGAPVLVSSSAAQLDNEGLRASGDLGLLSWLDSSSGSNAVHVSRRDPSTGLWSASAALATLPSGVATDYELAMTRTAAPVAHVAAVIGGNVYLTTSLDGGVSFGAAQLASPSGGVFQVELEAQGDRLALVYTDGRGANGTRALWLRKGTLIGGNLVLEGEIQLSDALEADALDPEVALEQDVLAAVWLSLADGKRILRSRTSLDFGANFGPAVDLPPIAANGAPVDDVLDFDLEITRDLLQVAATEEVGGATFVSRWDSFDGAIWNGEPVFNGFGPQFARVDGTPDAQTLVWNVPTGVNNGVTLYAISADQDDGCEYHDEFLFIGEDSGIDPALSVTRFAVAYNRLYDNFAIGYAKDEDGPADEVGVLGYRPLSMEFENAFPGSTDAHFALGHVPFDDAFVLVVLSFQEAKGSLLLPDGRDTGLALDPLTFLGLGEPLLSAAFLAPVDPIIEGAELGSLPFPLPAGLDIRAVGVSIRFGGEIRKVTDVLVIQT